jgi:sugar/nucleoside kinase (ribokinase family)
MVITNSEKAVIIAVGAHLQTEEYAFTVPVTPIEAKLLLDSNGAGDSFVGGFLAKLCQIYQDNTQLASKA